MRAWRRPLTAVSEEFREAGFLIERLLEPRPVPEMAERYPEDFARLSERRRSSRSGSSPGRLDGICAAASG